MSPKAKLKKKTGPLKVRLRVWDYTHRYEVFGAGRRWSEVASLAAARMYASKHAYAGIRIQPI